MYTSQATFCRVPRCQESDSDLFEGGTDLNCESLASFVEVCIDGEEGDEEDDDDEDEEGANNSRWVTCVLE
jgi:hypothetical protein